jgi:hypothetical protein
MRADLRLIATGLFALLLGACADAPTPVSDCSPQAQWRAGLERRLPDTACREDAAKEAHLLGTELAGLRAEFDELAEQLQTTTGESAGALQRRQRQLQIDIEAIESEARIQGWMRD